MVVTPFMIVMLKFGKQFLDVIPILEKEQHQSNDGFGKANLNMYRCVATALMENVAVM